MKEQTKQLPQRQPLFRRLKKFAVPTLVAGVMLLASVTQYASANFPMAQPTPDGQRLPMEHQWPSQDRGHAPVHERIGPFNYQFVSGPDWSGTFGNPTTVHVSTMILPDPSTQNIRRDRHASDLPLPYGVFSSIVDTPMANPSFQQALAWSNEWQPFMTEVPPPALRFDMAASPNVNAGNFTGIGSAWGAPGGSEMGVGSNWTAGSPSNEIVNQGPQPGLGVGTFMPPTSVIE